MMNEEEGAKLQLAEAHKYVQSFMTLRVSILAASIAFLGTMLTVVLKSEHTIERVSLWAFIALLHLLSIRTLGSVTRAIWLFCAHMFLIERKVYGPGGSHQWILANLRNRKFSSTHGVYIASIGLLVCTLSVMVGDLIVRSDHFSNYCRWLVTVAFFIWAFLVREATIELEPIANIELGVNEAIQSQNSIDEMEQLTDDQITDKAREPGALRPYFLLMQRARQETRPSIRHPLQR